MEMTDLQQKRDEMQEELDKLIQQIQAEITHRQGRIAMLDELINDAESALGLNNSDEADADDETNTD